MSFDTHKTSTGHFIPHTLTEAQLEEYEERRAILEAEGMDPLDADFAARRICMEHWKKSEP